MMLLAYNVKKHVFSSCLVSQVQGSCISRAAPENLNLSLAHKQVNVKFNAHVEFSSGRGVVGREMLASRDLLQLIL